uniref:Aquaporin n=1 Tax=Phenacoccus solenopsis TaxID=483260 RepID=A0A3G2KX50_9HEMI|nr:aquaporin-like protein [Phenacoccus solenopsis]QEY08361.1 aquaporin [Phenacoccus solenopsis]
MVRSLVGRGRVGKWIQIFLAEFTGTACLMYFGCMGLFADLSGFAKLAPLQGGISFGFTVSSLVASIGHISKAHLNPCVTLCAYLLGMISPITALIYFIAEVLGCCTGFWLLKVCSPQEVFWQYASSHGGLCNTLLHDNLVWWQGFLIEFFSTSLLIYLVCSAWDPRNAKLNDSIAIKFGLVVTVLSIVGGPFTGASLNPTRSFAPALVNGRWRDHWLYWIAPLSGSAATTLFYKYCLLDEDPPGEDMGEASMQLTSGDERVPVTQRSQNQV